MTRFQFKPDSGKKQKRADKRVKDRAESSHDDRFPNERYDTEGRPEQGQKRGKTVRGVGKTSGRAARGPSKSGPRTSAPQSAVRTTRDEFSALLHAWHDTLGDRPVTVRELLQIARSHRQGKKRFLLLRVPAS